MKNYLLLLLLLLALPAPASQIVVGLQSDNLLSWHVWEREGPALTHYLLLYNKSSAPLEIRIKLKRLRAVGNDFADVGPHKTLVHLQLPASQLTRLRYPKTKGSSDLLEYLENGRFIGLLPANTAQPDALALQDAAYRYYSNEGTNGSLSCYWLAFPAIYTPPTHVQLTVAASQFQPRSKFLKEEYYLAKLDAPGESTLRPTDTLDSLLVAGGRAAAITRLDSAHRRVVVPVRALAAAATQPVLLTLRTERVEDGYVFDAAKRLVPHKDTGGAMLYLPVFAGPPR